MFSCSFLALLMLLNERKTLRDLCGLFMKVRSVVIHLTQTLSLPSMTQSSEVDEEIPPNPPCLTGSQSKEGRVAP